MVTEISKSFKRLIIIHFYCKKPDGGVFAHATIIRIVWHICVLISATAPVFIIKYQIIFSVILIVSYITRYFLIHSHCSWFHSFFFLWLLNCEWIDRSPVSLSFLIILYCVNLICVIVLKTRAKWNTNNSTYFAFKLVQIIPQHIIIYECWPKYSHFRELQTRCVKMYLFIHFHFFFWFLHHVFNMLNTFNFYTFSWGDFLILCMLL